MKLEKYKTINGTSVNANILKLPIRIKFLYSTEEDGEIFLWVGVDPKEKKRQSYIIYFVREGEEIPKGSHFLNNPTKDIAVFYLT